MADSLPPTHALCTIHFEWDSSIERRCLEVSHSPQKNLYLTNLDFHFALLNRVKSFNSMMNFLIFSNFTKKKHVVSCWDMFHLLRYFWSMILHFLAFALPAAGRRLPVDSSRQELNVFIKWGISDGEEGLSTDPTPEATARWTNNFALRIESPKNTEERKNKTKNSKEKPKSWWWNFTCDPLIN